MNQIRNDLEYYLGYVPSNDLILEADEWQSRNPGNSLAEWCDAMAEAGLL